MRLSAPLTGHIARGMVRLVEARLPGARRLLDIACGPGEPSEEAARLCASRGAGSVLATDLSPAMIGLAEQRLAPFGPFARCEVRDGQALALDGQDFDAAFSCFGIFLFPDRAAGWRSAVDPHGPQSPPRRA